MIFTKVVTKRKEFERKPLDLPPDKAIIRFLNIIQKPQTFGDIRNLLKEKKIAYKNQNKNRKGLSLTLKRMVDKNQIIKLDKDNNYQYPRYITTTKNKTKFESALDGYLFRNETIGYMFRNMGRDFETDFDPKKMDVFVKTENKVKTLVNYLGVQMLDTILSSYVRPINSKESVKSNREYREVWLKNALSYHEPDIGIIDMFERVIVNNDDNKVFENKSLLKDINLMKKSLRKTYPNITEYIDYYEGHSKEVKDAMRDTYLTNKRFASKIID